MKPQPRFQASRCRTGACVNRFLPPVAWCLACRRIAVERRRLAKELARSLPSTVLASDLAPVPTTDAFRPGSGLFGWGVSPTAVVVEGQP